MLHIFNLTKIGELNILYANYEFGSKNHPSVTNLEQQVIYNIAEKYE